VSREALAPWGIGLAALAVALFLALALTGASRHGFISDCHTDGGRVTETTWNGVPVESTCHY
jgi:hypothetical protein